MITLVYIDPGTGSYFIQLLLGGILGLGITIKLYWKKLRARVFGRSPREES